jgi:hypothetical protein
MSAPVEFETLVDWVDGRLDPERAAEVAAHVEQGEPRVRAIVEWLRGLVEVGRRFPLEEPPPIVRQQLAARFAQWRDTERALADEIRRFDATVLFDSRERPVVAGVRGTLADEVVHLAYTSDAADLVLDVQRVPGHRVRIDGQVLPADAGGPSIFEATVSGAQFTIRTVDGDRLGRFRLDGVPEGAERLEVTNGTITLTVRLDLRPGVL